MAKFASPNFLDGGLSYLKTSTATAGSGATPNLHIAFTNGTSEVIYVTDETTDTVVSAGNTINWPALTYTSGQPT